jgi:tRNA splicing endonuclease
MSRAVRLAHNIRATLIWAVVDREGKVTFYSVKRITP